MNWAYWSEEGRASDGEKLTPIEKKSGLFFRKAWWQNFHQIETSDSRNVNQPWRRDLESCTNEIGCKLANNGLLPQLLQRLIAVGPRFYLWIRESFRLLTFISCRQPGRSSWPWTVLRCWIVFVIPLIIMSYDVCFADWHSRYKQLGQLFGFQFSGLLYLLPIRWFLQAAWPYYLKRMNFLGCSTNNVWRPQTYRTMLTSALSTSKMSTPT